MNRTTLRGGVLKCVLGATVLALAYASAAHATVITFAFSQEDFVEIAIIGFRCNANFECTGLDNGPGEIGVDNIVLSDLPPVGSVPEPATLSLLAFGLMGLGARMRRRH